MVIIDALAYAEFVAVGIPDGRARFEQANVSLDVDNSMGKDVSTWIHLHQTLFFFRFLLLPIIYLEPSVTVQDDELTAAGFSTSGP
jgi:hypothetical protein